MCFCREKMSSPHHGCNLKNPRNFVEQKRNHQWVWKKISCSREFSQHRRNADAEFICHFRGSDKKPNKNSLEGPVAKNPTGERRKSIFRKVVFGKGRQCMFCQKGETPAAADKDFLALGLAGVLMKICEFGAVWHQFVILCVLCKGCGLCLQNFPLLTLVHSWAHTF